MNERDARLALSCVVEPATARVAEAVAEFGATAVWQQLVERPSDSPLARRARGFDAAPVLARAAGDSVAGAGFGAIGVPYLFVGGLLTLADAGDRLGDPGAPHLLVAGTAALVGAAIGQIGISDGEGVFIAGIVAGAAAAAGAALGLTSLDGTQSAAVVREP